MTIFDEIFEELEKEINSISREYIEKFVPAKPEDAPSNYEYAVKSFCILAHASFEEFVESISEGIMNSIYSDFLQKKITLATISLLMVYGERPDPDDNDEQIQSCFEKIRSEINKSKSKHSIILSNNNGFSQKYLKKTLHPVGIDIPTDVRLADSLKKLADARGSFAHSMSKLAQYGTYKNANTPLSPEDAKKIVADCLQLCEKIRDNANNRW